MTFDLKKTGFLSNLAASTYFGLINEVDQKFTIQLIVLKLSIFDLWWPQLPLNLHKSTVILDWIYTQRMKFNCGVRFELCLQSNLLYNIHTYSRHTHFIEMYIIDSLAFGKK